MNDDKKTFSKKCKILIIITLIGALIIFFDNFITSMDWYWELRIGNLFIHNDKLQQALKALDDLIEVFNWLIVVIITCLSIVFLVIDKKQNKNITIYEWYIIAGFFHIFIGTVGITSIMYSLATLIIIFLNRNILNSKFYSIFSLIIFLILLITIIGKATGLFDKIEEKADEIKENIENRDKIIEDNDNTYIVTTFDNFIKDWGNDITKNKAFKIQNVKLDNITASLYIDYNYELNGEIPMSTITFKHGNDEIYTFTSKSITFNISYLSLYDNLIIYGTSICDNVNNGICEKHLTYSKALAFNKDVMKTFYDYQAIEKSDGSVIDYPSINEFLEDKDIYAEPYNDFRIYNIDIKNNYLYFDTLAETYDYIFASDSLHYKNNCKNPYWNSIKFDMQRTFQVNFTKTYNVYEINKQKVNSITYADYCEDKNVLSIN